MAEKFVIDVDKGVDSYEKMRRAGLLHIEGWVGPDNIFQPGPSCSEADAKRVQDVLDGDMPAVSVDDARRIAYLNELGDYGDQLDVIISELSKRSAETPEFAELVRKRDDIKTRHPKRKSK